MNVDKEVLTVLTSLKNQGLEIRLINVYKGFPISFPARIKSVSSESALLQIHQYQTICIQLAHYTYIKTPNFNQVVKANVSHLDFQNLLAVIKDFSYAHPSIGERELIRVEPASNLNATISNGIIAKADVINISTRGVGIYLDHASFAPRAFGAGQKVQLSAELLPNQVLNSAGLVKNVIVDENMNRYRLGIKTFPDAANELLLSRYIAQRQLQILKEIKELVQKI